MLVLNAGSSSLKFALYNASSPSGPIEQLTARGEISGLDAAPLLRADDAAGAVLADRSWPRGQPDPFGAALDALLSFAEGHLDSGGLVAVGHRVVHGGDAHVGPALVTPALLADLDALVALAPLHMPHNLLPIRALAVARPGLPQVVCFDTAFHHTMPEVARRFGLPRALTAQGVRRFGFHGLSYEWIARQLASGPGAAGSRVVVAHLGAGASLCALRDGKSVATTMGFSVLDGLMMATRCGSIDPGIIFHLLRLGHGAAELEDMLYHRSGLLGVSGLSGDVRELLASEDPAAAEALDLFAYRIATSVAEMACALGGIDELVFTAGIGEHAARVRAAVCARLAWLGVALDEDRNNADAAHIAQPASVVDVRVIATDEEAVIAGHTRAAGLGRVVRALA